ncbi:MAG: low molecular weight phosphotyrosine protein phosphatase [SAR324 cluster bacterium]|nr:low molecular weight phosphotyrosine protein phosphatase [SAR324 cluster bacterium]
MNSPQSVKILFVCMGNICRSPAAEGIMQTLVRQAGLNDRIVCDSAGTIGYHTGEKADARMRSHSQKRGYELLSLSRQFDPGRDFEKFDLIITMDNHNYKDVIAMSLDNVSRKKVFRMTDFCQRIKDIHEVPDPYYDGDQGFEMVLDLLEDACTGLLEYVRKTWNL